MATFTRSKHALSVKHSVLVTGISLPTLVNGAAGVAVIPLTGVQVGDSVILNWQSTIDTGLVQMQPAYVNATNSIVVPFFNPTASNVTPASTVNANVDVI